MFNAAIRTSGQNASAFGALFGATYGWLVWIFLSVLNLYQKCYGESFDTLVKLKFLSRNQIKKITKMFREY